MRYLQKPEIFSGFFYDTYMEIAVSGDRVMIVGLGNPGAKSDSIRHHVGCVALA
mgnify:CR=1 FL=1